MAVFSCSPVKYVPESDYLLHDVEVKLEKKVVGKSEVKNYVRQKPNKKIFGFIRFHLGLYNLSKIEKDNWFNNWLREIGEKPVVYDEFLTRKSWEQIGLYMRNKGFYNAEVSDTVLFHKDKRATVQFFIKPGKPYLINSIGYNLEDTGLVKYIIPDTVNRLIKPGDKFDVDKLQEERVRIEQNLKSLGFYDFSKEFIYIEADTSIGDYKVDLILGIRENIVQDDVGNTSLENHKRYKINKLYFIDDYDPALELDNNGIPVGYKMELFDSIPFYHYNDLTLKPAVLEQSNYIRPGKYYNINDADKTYRHISSLRVFKFVDVKFLPVGLNDGDKEKNLLDCSINLSPLKLQSYAIEVEGTNSSGNIGVAGNLVYQHRNLFRGAEILDIRVRGAVETFNETYRNDLKNTLEFGLEANLRLPKFLLPFKTEQFIKKYNPKTAITAAYNYQRRPDYTRTIANATFGYNWRQTNHISHIVNPFELNAVKIFEIDQAFLDTIRGTYLENSYKDHYVSITSYSFVFNNQEIGSNKNFSFLRLNAETGGNSLLFLSQAANFEREEGNYRLFGLRFAQYIRSDLDYRYYQTINETDKLVYRIFAGAGLPYGNSEALPFEKKYFGGGANSLRAWQVRTLGPGSWSGELGRYPNVTADIKIEGSMEYRFKLFWILEGAMFLDAGNIWAISENDERVGALFEVDKFYKDIAIGTGFGLRFDFNFFLFRIDAGMKLRDPSYLTGQRWLPGNRPLTGDDMAVSVGIGYPF
ncbi:MAG: BamA/TamA family outer membrane protein [Bacteroidales bacterium]